MDAAALAAVNLFLKRRRKAVRICAAAFAGSVAGLLILMCVHNYLLYCLVTHFLLNTGMVWLCFGKTGGREFLENWFVSYIAVLLAGGIMDWMKENGIFSGEWTPAFFATLAAGYIIIGYLAERKTFGNHMFPVQMRVREKTVEVTGYWDSGNQLQDVYTGKAVSILSRERFEELFEVGECAIRYVPFSSLGQENGMLAVADVDELVIYQGKKAVRIERAAIGAANEGLLEQKEYDLILHASLLG